MFTLKKRHIVCICCTILSIAYLTTSSLVLAQTMSLEPSASPIGPPEKVEDLKPFQKALKEFPEGLKNAWQDGLVFWGKMENWIVNTWNSSRAGQWLNNLWKTITTPIAIELEWRKQILPNEFNKEKQELQKDIKTEVPEAGKSVWDKIKHLFK